MDKDFQIGDLVTFTLSNENKNLGIIYKIETGWHYKNSEILPRNEYFVKWITKDGPFATNSSITYNRFHLRKIC